MNDFELAWENFKGSLNDTVESAQQDVAKGWADSVLAPLKDAAAKFLDTAKGASQTQSDVTKLASFSDSVKRYVVGVTVVVVLVGAYLLFGRKRGGR